MPISHKIVITSFLCIGVLAVLFAMYKSKRFFRTLFSSSLQGVISLFAVNVLGAFTGVTVAVNTYTLAASCLFGIPAVISALLFNTIFAIK